MIMGNSSFPHQQLNDEGQQLVEHGQEGFLVGLEQRVKKVAKFGQGVNVLKRNKFIKLRMLLN